MSGVDGFVFFDPAKGNNDSFVVKQPRRCAVLRRPFDGVLLLLSALLKLLIREVRSG